LLQFKRCAERQCTESFIAHSLTSPLGVVIACRRSVRGRLNFDQATLTNWWRQRGQPDLPHLVEISKKFTFAQAVTNNAPPAASIIEISRRKHWIGMPAPSSSLMISTLRIGCTVRRMISAR
jgi:hypothetical protein